MSLTIMHFAFTEEQQSLRRAARSFLRTRSAPDVVRRLMDDPLGYDRETWRRVSDELGWPALIVPEAYGGAGFGSVELSAIMEESGRTLFAGPLFSSVCLFENALVLAGSEAQKIEVLPAVSVGAKTGAVAHVEPLGGIDASDIAAIARTNGGDFVLSGTKSYVVDGGFADFLIVAARAEDSSDADGVSLFLLDSDEPGITRRVLPTLDQTRKLSEIRLADVRVPARALVGTEGGGAAILERVLDLARIALAAEQVGAAERCLEMSIDYAKLRVQFGRPVGSFQAIKHKLAEIFVLVESARSVCYYAASVAASGGPELARAASLAKAYCSEAFFHAAAENIQIHGGVGFTWEHEAHLYLKRAKASEVLLGDPAYHRERYARLIGI